MAHEHGIVDPHLAQDDGEVGSLTELLARVGIGEVVEIHAALPPESLRKLEAVRCYSSQLEPDGATDKGAHFLFGADILGRMETKARFFGERIGARYGEPLLSVGPLACADPGAWLVSLGRPSITV